MGGELERGEGGCVEGGSLLMIDLALNSFVYIGIIWLFCGKGGLFCAYMGSFADLQIIDLALRCRL